jgi:hypothetical protein
VRLALVGRGLGRRALAQVRPGLVADGAVDLDVRRLLLQVLLVGDDGVVRQAAEVAVDLEAGARLQVEQLL